MTVPDPVITIVNEAPVLGVPFWTLLAALMTTLITGSVLLWVERKKWNGSRAVADELSERKVCRTFVSEVNAYYSKVCDTDANVSDHAMRSAYTDLEFIASPDLVKAAKSVVLAAGYVSFAKSASGADDPFQDDETVDKALRWYHWSRVEFTNAYRARYRKVPLPRSKTPVDKPAQIAAWEAELYSTLPDIPEPS